MNVAMDSVGANSRKDEEAEVNEIGRYEDDLEDLITFTLDRSPALPQESITPAIDDSITRRGSLHDDIFEIIPVDILASIFSRWLTIKDISRLDIAVCSTAGRSAYLNSVSSQSSTHFGSKKAFGNDYVRWLSARAISIQHFRGDRVRLTDDAISEVNSQNHNCWGALVHLDLQSCIKVKVSSILKILCFCSKVTTLNLAASRISNDVLVQVSTTLPHLQSLCLMGNGKVSDPFIIEVSEKCSLIHSLNLSYCGSKISENGLVTVCTSLPHLVRLQLAGNFMVTNKVLLSLSNNCPNLKWLDLDQCVNITMPVLTVAVRRWRLESLDLPSVHIFSVLSDYISLLESTPLLVRLGVRKVPHGDFERQICQRYPRLLLDRSSSRSDSIRAVY
jgi:hypothetical protein